MIVNLRHCCSWKNDIEVMAIIGDNETDYLSCSCQYRMVYSDDG